MTNKSTTAIAILAVALMLGSAMIPLTTDNSAFGVESENAQTQSSSDDSFFLELLEKAATGNLTIDAELLYKIVDRLFTKTFEFIRNILNSCIFQKKNFTKEALETEEAQQLFAAIDSGQVDSYIALKKVGSLLQVNSAFSLVPVENKIDFSKLNEHKAGTSAPSSIGADEIIAFYDGSSTTFTSGTGRSMIVGEGGTVVFFPIDPSDSTRTFNWTFEFINGSTSIDNSMILVGDGAIISIFGMSFKVVASDVKEDGSRFYTTLFGAVKDSFDKFGLEGKYDGDTNGATIKFKDYSAASNMEIFSSMFMFDRILPVGSDISFKFTDISLTQSAADKKYTFSADKIECKIGQVEIFENDGTEFKALGNVSLDATISDFAMDVFFVKEEAGDGKTELTSTLVIKDGASIDIGKLIIPINKDDRLVIIKTTIGLPNGATLEEKLTVEEKTVESAVYKSFDFVVSCTFETLTLKTNADGFIGIGEGESKTGMKVLMEDVAIDIKDEFKFTADGVKSVEPTEKGSDWMYWLNGFGIEGLTVEPEDFVIGKMTIDAGEWLVLENVTLNTAEACFEWRMDLDKEDVFVGFNVELTAQKFILSVEKMYYLFHAAIAGAPFDFAVELDNVMLELQGDEKILKVDFTLKGDKSKVDSLDATAKTSGLRLSVDAATIGLAKEKDPPYGMIVKLATINDLSLKIILDAKLKMNDDEKDNFVLSATSSSVVLAVDSIDFLQPIFKSGSHIGIIKVGINVDTVSVTATVDDESSNGLKDFTVTVKDINLEASIGETYVKALYLPIGESTYELELGFDRIYLGININEVAFNYGNLFKTGLEGAVFDADIQLCIVGFTFVVPKTIEAEGFYLPKITITDLNLYKDGTNGQPIVIALKITGIAATKADPLALNLKLTSTKTLISVEEFSTENLVIPIGKKIISIGHVEMKNLQANLSDMLLDVTVKGEFGKGSIPVMPHSVDVKFTLGQEKVTVESLTIGGEMGEITVSLDASVPATSFTLNAVMSIGNTGDITASGHLHIEVDGETTIKSVITDYATVKLTITPVELDITLNELIFNMGTMALKKVDVEVSTSMENFCVNHYDPDTSELVNTVSFGFNIQELHVVVYGSGTQMFSYISVSLESGGKIELRANIELWDMSVIPYPKISDKVIAIQDVVLSINTLNITIGELDTKEKTNPEIRLLIEKASVVLDGSFSIGSISYGHLYKTTEKRTKVILEYLEGFELKLDNINVTFDLVKGQQEGLAKERHVVVTGAVEVNIKTVDANKIIDDGEELTGKKVVGLDDFRFRVYVNVEYTSAKAIGTDPESIIAMIMESQTKVTDSYVKLTANDIYVDLGWLGDITKMSNLPNATLDVEDININVTVNVNIGAEQEQQEKKINGTERVLTDIAKVGVKGNISFGSLSYVQSASKFVEDGKTTKKLTAEIQNFSIKLKDIKVSISKEKEEDKSKANDITRLWDTTVSGGLEFNVGKVAVNGLVIDSKGAVIETYKVIFIDDFRFSANIGSFDYYGGSLFSKSGTKGAMEIVAENVSASLSVNEFLLDGSYGILKKIPSIVVSIEDVYVLLKFNELSYTGATDATKSKVEMGMDVQFILKFREFGINATEYDEKTKEFEKTPIILGVESDINISAALSKVDTYESGKMTKSTIGIHVTSDSDSSFRIGYISTDYLRKYVQVLIAQKILSYINGLSDIEFVLKATDATVTITKDIAKGTTDYEYNISTGVKFSIGELVIKDPSVKSEEGKGYKFKVNIALTDVNLVIDDKTNEVKGKASAYVSTNFDGMDRYVRLDTDFDIVDDLSGDAKGRTIDTNTTTLSINLPLKNENFLKGFIREMIPEQFYANIDGKLTVNGLHMDMSEIIPKEITMKSMSADFNVGLKNAAYFRGFTLNLTDDVALNIMKMEFSAGNITGTIRSYGEENQNFSITDKPKISILKKDGTNGYLIRIGQGTAAFNGGTIPCDLTVGSKVTFSANGLSAENFVFESSSNISGIVTLRTKDFNYDSMRKITIDGKDVAIAMNEKLYDARYTMSMSLTDLEHVTVTADTGMQVNHEDEKSPGQSIGDGHEYFVFDTPKVEMLRSEGIVSFTIILPDGETETLKYGESITLNRLDDRSTDEKFLGYFDGSVNIFFENGVKSIEYVMPARNVTLVAIYDAKAEETEVGSLEFVGDSNAVYTRTISASEIDKMGDRSISITATGAKVEFKQETAENLLEKQSGEKATRIQLELVVNKATESDIQVISELDDSSLYHIRLTNKDRPDEPVLYSNDTVFTVTIKGVVVNGSIKGFQIHYVDDDGNISSVGLKSYSRNSDGTYDVTFDCNHFSDYLIQPVYGKASDASFAMMAAIVAAVAIGAMVFLIPLLARRRHEDE